MKCITSRSWAFLRAIAPGILVAHIVGTLQVHLSDVGLSERLAEIGRSGYLPVPGPRIDPVLGGWESAVFGGLFFAFSVGAAVSLLTLAALLAWRAIPPGNRRLRILFLFCCSIVWGGSIVLFNLRGVNLITSAYLIAVPGSILWFNRHRSPELGTGRAGDLPLLLFPLLLGGALWILTPGQNPFIEIRDRILLSSSFGERLNDFYYRYTLYPAEAFKRLDQKMLKTCDFSEVPGPADRAALEKTLLRYDYIATGEKGSADLAVAQKGEVLSFYHHNHLILEIPCAEVLRDPGRVLADFSVRSDRFLFFRLFSFYSILISVPLLLFLFVNGALARIFLFWRGPRFSETAALALCLAGLIAILPLLRAGLPAPGSHEGLEKALHDENPLRRMVAIRQIAESNLDISFYSAYSNLINDPDPRVRYWLARSLGSSRRSRTYSDLLSMLSDPRPNVVCMALDSLGRRGNRSAVKEIFRLLEESDHWYIRWYAYRSLRSLGWIQDRLI